MRIAALAKWNAEAFLISLFEPLLSRMAREILQKNPGILDRLQQHADATIVIAPEGLPLAFQLRAGAAQPVRVRRASDLRDWDARVTASFMNLLAMAQGKLDGDALFFSREMAIEGDTSAILALRNALDAADIDLVGEFCGLLGPLDRPAGLALRTLIAVSERQSGHGRTFPEVYS